MQRRKKNLMEFNVKVVVASLGREEEARWW